MEPDEHTTLDNADAPEPEDPRKPLTPLELSGRGWWYAIRRAFWKALFEIDTDAAGALTYFAGLSLFPALLALVSLLSVVGQAEQTTAWILDLLSSYAPPTIIDLLTGPILGLTTQQNAGWVLAGSLVIAVWSASGYVASFGRTMNRIYGVAEGRPLWKVIPYNLLLTLMSLGFGLTAVLALFLSSGLAQLLAVRMELQTETYLLWDLIRWPILGVGGVLYVTALYYLTPNVRPTKFRWITLGAVVALALIGLAMAGFNFYVSNFGRWNATYGVIGSFIVLLLGIWMINMALIIGARLNAELERVRQLEAGIDASDTIQLPPRDDRGVRAFMASRDAFVAEAREILADAQEQQDGRQPDRE